MGKKINFQFWNKHRMIIYVQFLRELIFFDFYRVSYHCQHLANLASDESHIPPLPEAVFLTVNIIC